MTTGETKQAKPRSRFQEIASRLFRHEEAVRVIILVALIGGFGIATGGAVLRTSNMYNVVIQSAQTGAAAIGIGIVMIAGGLDLSLTGIALLGGAVCSKMISAGSLGMLGLGEGWLANPVPLGVGVLLFLLVGMGWGRLNGIIITRSGADPLIPTIASGMIATGICYAIMRPESNIGNFPPALTLLAGGTIAGVPYPVILFIGVVGVAYFFMGHTTFGRQVYGVGGNEVSAWLSGIDVRQIRVQTYMISGLLAGLAGLVLLSRNMQYAVVLVGPVAINALTAALIGGARLGGGKGTIIGIAIGVMMLGVIHNGMNHIGLELEYQHMITGAIIALTVGIDYWRMRRS